MQFLKSLSMRVRAKTTESETAPKSECTHQSWGLVQHRASGIIEYVIGESPSGKAADFGSAIRGFESFLPSTTGHYPNIVLSLSR